MRKAQDFSVYPAQEKTDYITIQSQTRFGKIEMTTGRGLMSQSHTNGAYSYHFQMDRKEKFQLTNEQLSELKKELAKTAGKEVGNMGVISDNTYADQFAKGGNVEGLQTEIHNLKRKLVAQAKSKGISENFGQKEVRMLEEKYPMNYSVGQFDEWVQNFDLDSYANGGKLSNKATYIPKRDIAEVEVEKDDKTTYVDGANLYDGVYVKKGKFAKGGKTSRVNYNDILPILKEKLEDGVEILLPNDFENSSEYKGEEVESKSRDGFIAFTDGGYEVTWFEYVSMFNGGGYKLPTKALDNELQRQVEYNYQYAKDRIKDLYPEIVEELGEDNIDYSSLNDAGYESIAEQLSEYEMDNNDTIMCSVGAYYYSPENSRSKDGKHTIRVFGVVNLESPYHRRGNLEDSIDIDITFDSIEEMEEKLDYEISEICSGWFNGANYNESTEKLRVVRMAKGGKLSNNATYIPKRDIAEVEVEKDGKTTFVDGANLYDGVYVKKGKFAKGGMVTKGELVWKKLSSSDKIIFLLENFTPEITPRGQEILVGKSYNFLPKNVKQVLQSKYANVEEYAKGGKLSNKATYIPKRDIAEVEVEKDGKTTFVDGANLYDGVYVKKGKFAKGGQAFLTIADLVQSALEENYDYPKDEADEITEYFYSHIQNMHNMGKSADEIADDVVRLLNERAENLKKKMKFDNDYVVVPWDSSEANKFAKGGEVSTYKKANWRFW